MHSSHFSQQGDRWDHPCSELPGCHEIRTVKSNDIYIARRNGKFQNVVVLGVRERRAPKKVYLATFPSDAKPIENVLN